MENILKESTDKDEQYWINFLERLTIKSQEVK